MAARRLIAVLVVLLVVSSIAAALAPEARRVTTSTTTGADTTSTEPTAPNSQPGPDTRDPADQTPAPAPVEAEEELPAGKFVERTISVGAGAGDDKQGDGKAKQPPAIEASVGDRLALEVASADTAEIEIPDFGLLETAAAGSPARFDLLLREPGSFPVRVIGGPAVGVISVTEPAEATSEPDGAKAG